MSLSSARALVSTLVSASRGRRSSTPSCTWSEPHFRNHLPTQREIPIPSTQVGLQAAERAFRHLRLKSQRVGSGQEFSLYAEQNGLGRSAAYAVRASLLLTLGGAIVCCLRRLELAFTGLQVASTQGQWLICAGCFVLALGLMMTFYAIHARFWAVPVSDDRGRLALWVGASATKNRGEWKNRFERLVAQIQKELDIESSIPVGRQPDNSPDAAKVRPASRSRWA